MSATRAAVATLVVDNQINDKFIPLAELSEEADPIRSVEVIFSIMDNFNYKSFMGMNEAERQLIANVVDRAFAKIPKGIHVDGPQCHAGFYLVNLRTAMRSKGLRPDEYNVQMDSLRENVSAMRASLK